MAVGRVKQGSRPPWVGLAAAAWVQVAAGSGFTFPLYSPALKGVLGYSQQQLTLLGVANDVGENVGLIPGIACNRLPPWAVLLVGAACSVLGFGVLWLSVTRAIVGIPYWLLWIALCIATNSGAWLGTAVLVTNMRNFPLSRGTVAGILKGYVALSASVFTVIYSGVLHNSSSKLLLFLALGVPAICLLMMYLIRPCVPSLEDDTMERGHFQFVQAASVLLGLYLLFCTILNDALPVKDTVSYVLAGVVILFLLAPLAIPVKMTLFPVKRNPPGSNGESSSSQGLTAENLETSEPLLEESSSAPHLGSFMEGDEDTSDVSMLLAEGEGAVKKKRRPRRGEDFTFREALVKADFWLLFMVYFLGVGSGVTVLNNLAQIGMASGINDSTILLCLFGFCNFTGRLCGGVISEHFVRSRTLPRSIWMAFTQLIMALTYLLFAYGPKNTLYLSTLLLGTCYGVQFSVMVPTASELFGLKHFGIIYNFMLLGNPLGALMFSGLLAGYIYDKEAAKQQAGLLLDATCLGPQCFRITFLVLACVCILGSLLSTVLTRRVKPVYEMLYSSGSFRLPRSSVR